MGGLFPIVTAYMQTADILSHPAWDDTGEDLTIDIVPSGAATVGYGAFPIASYGGAASQFSHVGYTECLGPITSPDLFRLRKGTQVFLIARIKDWEGFFVLDLDEVVGA